MARLEGEIAQNKRARKDFVKNNEDTPLFSATANGAITVVMDFLINGADIKATGGARKVLQGSNLSYLS